MQEFLPIHVSIDADPGSGGPWKWRAVTALNSQ